MYLTIEELLALKEQYVEEIYKLQAKIDVVCDLVELAKSKVVETEQVEPVEEETEQAYGEVIG